MRNLEEIQSFRDNKQVMLLLVGLILLPLCFWIIGWLQMDEFDQEELWMMAGTVLIVIITILGVTRMKTYVRLETDKLVFRNSPFLQRRKTIKLTEIRNWEITNHKWMNGLGYRVNFNGTWSYVMSPGKVLAISTKDGRNYRFGINRPELVKRFITSNWEVNKNRYG